MDGNAKHDLEHTAEKTVAISGKSGKVFSKLFGKFIVRATRYYNKHFSSSMNALRNDGPTKELFTTDVGLTKSETQQIIAAARENDVLIGVKKMTPDGEHGANKSLHQQEKMAYNQIKYRKWNDRCKTVHKIKLLSKFCIMMAAKYKALSLSTKTQIKQKKWEERSRKYSKIKPLGKYCSKKSETLKKLVLKESQQEEDKYVIIVNKSRVSFFNEQLEKITKDRIKKTTDNEYKEMGEDELTDKKPLKSRGMNLTVADLNKQGEDFGSCLVRDYQSNYCVQKISKQEYCEIREQLFNFASHGACVLNENEMMIAIRSVDLDEYRTFAPLDKPIKEYGAKGAREIETESNSNDIIELEILDYKEYKLFKEKYNGKDYIAQHSPSGKITILVKETDTKNMVEESKKKSKTADLVKEANEYAEKNNQIKETIDLELEEEQDIDR